MATYDTLKKEQPSKPLINIGLTIGMFLIVYGLLTDQPIIAIGAIIAPIGLFIIGYGLINPRFTYIIYTIYAYFFMYMMRYFRKEGFSVGLDILLLYIVAALLLTILNRKSNLTISNAINGLTICYSIWIIFILFQMLNPGTNSEGITRGFRTLIIGNLILYIVFSIISNTPKMLKTFLILWSILTIIAFIKVLYQKYIGFDQGEKHFLYAQMAYRTHILNTGIRYFSFFSDAGNFGPNMGAMTVIFGTASLFEKQKKLKILFLFTFIIALFALFLSGTRSAIVVPFAGFALFCLLCKNIKTFSYIATIGILSFIFLAFTNIGDNNKFIRRMRTAIRPTEDASYNVRQTNKILIAEHLKDKPFGVGIYKAIPYLWSNQDGSYSKGTLPPDSYFVDIWIQHGIVGLCLHIVMYIAMLLWGSYIILFRVKDNRLRQILAGFLGAVFGLLINGYAGECIGQAPTNLLLVALLAFVMNGSYIDKQLQRE